MKNIINYLGLWNNDKYGDVNFGTNSSNFNNVTLLIDAT